MNLMYYYPLVCAKSEDCNRIRSDPQFPSLVKSEENQGNTFCENTENTPGTVCCHPAAIDKDRGFKENWEVPVLLPDQKYTRGFRSSFQCEQYAKYICDETTDTCPQSHQPGAPVAGEIPHLALIGITYPQSQYFFCSGTVVTRFYILSARECKSHDGRDAAVVLTGDFDLWTYGEEGSSETLSEIIGALKPPREWPDALELLILQLRKPLVFGPFLRPACVNNKVGFISKQDPRPPGTISGYGTVTTNGRWSQYPKNIAVDLTRDTNTNSKKCDVPAGTKHYWAGTKHYCYERSAGGPCEFDLGAAIVYKYYRLYCQWIVYGVASNEVTNCTSSDTITFVTERADWYWKSLEDILFINDFNLYEFDMSQPTCDPQEQKFMRKFLSHLRSDFNNRYPKNYLAPPEHLF